MPYSTACGEGGVYSLSQNLQFVSYSKEYCFTDNRIFVHSRRARVSLVKTVQSAFRITVKTNTFATVLLATQENNAKQVR